MSTIEFTLNGRAVAIDVDPLRPLLRVLREDLGLTGAKQACDMEGECGACTIILDGEAVRACLIPTGKVTGRSVTTVEGLGTRASPHPLQVAFLASGAVQCGYCTPGMLLAAKALLDREPRPTHTQIIEALDGNLCRCTGYAKIVAAVEMAAEMMRPSGVGPAVVPDGVRHGGWERVSGTAAYAEDITMPGMHYLKVVRSPHWHARLLAFDLEPALAVPGVVSVLTAADIPGDNSGLGGYSLGEHLLASLGGEVRMRGDPVALVIGTSPDAAAAGAAAVHAEYEVLPHTFEIWDALQQGALQVHPEGNLLAQHAIETGDIAAALAESECVLTARYESPFQVAMPLERESAIGYIDELGRVAVIGGNHEPHWCRAYLSRILALPEEHVRVIAPPMGGSFGAKQDVWPLAAAALAAYHLRKPVRLAYTRREVMEAAPKRHPYDCRCSVGATSDGRLTGLQFEAAINTGAYDSGGWQTAEFGALASVGAYRWQATSVRTQTIYSFAPKAGQMRGYGTPQAVFTVECSLDELAQALNVDPLDLRRRNALLDDEVSGLGYPLAESMGYVQALDALEGDYRAALARASEFNAGAGRGLKRRGVGLAGMWYRYGKFGPALSQAEAELGLDGTVVIYCSSVDYGQGINTVFVEVAAEALGLPPSAVRLVSADTAKTVDSDISGASRNTFWAGAAVADAARRLRGMILSTAAEMLGTEPSRLVLDTGGVHVAGGPAPESGAQRSPTREGGDGRPAKGRVTFAEVAAEVARSGHPRRVLGSLDLRARFGSAPDSPHIPVFVTGAQMAEVEVDTGTGETHVLSVSAAHDVGRAMNRRDAEGQIQGSIVMGMGSALMEEFLPGLSTGFGNYYIPTVRSLPELRVHLVEVPSRWGLGAKGLGEAATLPTAPAIVNAISRAVGVRVRALPASPERVLTALGRLSSERA